jgi:hypothetical protein
MLGRWRRAQARGVHGPVRSDGERHVWQPKNVATHKDCDPLKVIYSHNKSGAINSERCMDYMMKETIPAMGIIRAEPECGEVEVVDGCSCHLSYERMKKGAELGLSTCLRVSYSSFATQGENKVHFRILKPGFQKGKRERLKDKMQRNKTLNTYQCAEHTTPVVVHSQPLCQPGVGLGQVFQRVERE